MSFSTFLRGAALAVAAFALGCSAASAADAPKLNDKQRTKGMTDAPAYIQAAGIPCDVSDAYYVGESTIKDAAGKTTKLSVLEVACKVGGGYMLNKNTTTQAVEKFNCTQAYSQNVANPKAIKCVLPANEKHYEWLTPLAQKLDSACTVNQARWIGTVAEEKFDRYEVACTGRAGFLLDIPYGDSKTQLSMLNCMIAAKGNSACQFTTAEQTVQSLQDPVKTSGQTCTVEKARWLGRISAENTDFYEIGCAGKPGFVLQTDTAMKYKATFGCDRAGTLGPCQFTDAAALTASAREAYGAKLKAAGANCTVAEYTVIGSEPTTKRDLIEFKCPEQKYGLAAFLPSEGSTAKTELMDCFTMVARRKECTYVTREQLDQQIGALIKTVKQDCDIKQINYLGRSDEADGVLVEIACVNKRGYIADIAKSRTAFTDAVPCSIARSRKYDLQCEIPGNGTYVPPSGVKED